jgi:hypothetical protein
LWRGIPRFDASHATARVQARARGVAPSPTPWRGEQWAGNVKRGSIKTSEGVTLEKKTSNV